MPLCVSCSMVTPIYITTKQGGLSLTILFQKLRVGSWKLEEEMGRELEGRQLDKELA